MAKQVVFQIVDDISGEEIPEGHGEVINFSVNGVSYDIDLNEENAKSFHDALGPFIAAARKKRTGHASLRSTLKSSNKMTQLAGSGLQTSAIREWCNANNHPVGARGRIPAEAMAAFDSAH